MSYTYFDIALLFATTIGLAILVFRLFSKWWSQLQANRKHRLFDSGYTYALESLAKNKLTPNELLEQAHNPFHTDEFDQGIKQAVRDYLQDQRKIDDVTK
jgi:hypothetical protein